MKHQNLKSWTYILIGISLVLFPLKLMFFMFLLNIPPIMKTSDLSTALIIELGLGMILIGLLLLRK